MSITAVTYTTFGNTIVHENRAGVEHDYVPDPLGSTVGMLDSNQNITDTFAYWPYGEIQNQSGSTGTPFTFVGTLGYCQDSATRFAYVRARYYSAPLARWVTVDPIWPDQESYAYVNGNPAGTTDETGLIAPSLESCEDFCKTLYVDAFKRKLCIYLCNLTPRPNLPPPWAYPGPITNYAFQIGYGPPGWIQPGLGATQVNLPLGPDGTFSFGADEFMKNWRITAEVKIKLK